MKKTIYVLIYLLIMFTLLYADNIVPEDFKDNPVTYRGWYKLTRAGNSIVSERMSVEEYEQVYGVKVKLSEPKFDPPKEGDHTEGRGKSKQQSIIDQYVNITTDFDKKRIFEDKKEYNTYISSLTKDITIEGNYPSLDCVSYQDFKALFEYLRKESFLFTIDLEDGDNIVLIDSIKPLKYHKSKLSSIDKQFYCVSYCDTPEGMKYFSDKICKELKVNGSRCGVIPLKNYIRYLRYKQIEACKQLSRGEDLSNIAKVVGKYYYAKFGSARLYIVEKIVMKDGKEFPIQDCEKHLIGSQSKIRI